MTTKNTDVTNKLFELANDTYRTYVKSLVWSQERALELTKVLVGQADSFQTQGKGLVEEYANQIQRSQQLFQTIWQETVKTNTELVNQYRVVTNENLNDLNSRLDTLQTKLETAARKN